MYFLMASLALACGVILVVQVGANAVLGRSLDNAFFATAANMLVGLVCTVLLLILIQKPLPTAATLRGAPGLSWIAGGALGTAYLTANILLAPRLGAAALVGFVVTGQLIFAVVADHFGWLGFAQHPANLWRCAGCVLMMGGVALIARF